MLKYDDLIKHTMTFVQGACVEWNSHSKQFIHVTSHDFHDFVFRTHIIAYKYLQGQIPLDGSCSDFECEVAMNVKKIFGVHLPKE